MKTNEKELQELTETDIKKLNGGIIWGPYIVGWAAVYTAAHVAAYYKGYSDAGERFEPCT